MDKPLLKLTLPLDVLIGTKRGKPNIFRLNLNIYRSTHYRVLNTAKIAYSDLVLKFIPKSVKPFNCPIRIEYTLFTGTKRKCDVSNVCSVVDKFACDCLTKAGLIEDDNYEHVKEVVYRYGSYDKGFERVEMEVFEYEI